MSKNRIAQGEGIPGGSSVEFGNVDDFLGHSTRGGDRKRLGNWKEDGSIDIWLHPKGMPAAVWSHPWYRLVEDRDNAGKKKLWGARFNSCEPEVVLKKRYFRDADGAREYPPTVCPFSLMLEWVYQAIETGELNWTENIFVFEGDDDVVEVKAGGFCGMFQQKDLTKEQLVELKKARVRVAEAFKENCHAKCHYVFQVINAAKLEDGPVIAFEGEALGKKMQIAIGKEIKRHGEKGKALGDPFHHPYPFRWEYDDTKSFSDKYDVTAIAEEPSDEVRAAFEMEPPSKDDYTQPSNLVELRRSFEAHWVGSIVPPWDEIFGPAMERFKGTEQAQAPEDFPHGANAADADAPDEDAPDEADAAVGEEGDGRQFDEDGTELFACDVCEKPVRADATTCPHCKAVFDSVAKQFVPAKKPEPKPLPKRGAGGKGRGRP